MTDRLRVPNQHHVNTVEFRVSMQIEDSMKCGSQCKLNRFASFIKLSLLIAQCLFDRSKQGIFGEEQTGSTAASSCCSTGGKWKLNLCRSLFGSCLESVNEENTEFRSIIP